MRNKILLALLLACVLSVSGCYSCHSWLASQGKEPVDPTAKYMWDKNCYAKQTPMPLPEICEPAAPKPKPVKPKPVKVKPVMIVAANAASRTYPCEDCGVVRLDKILPERIQTGADFEYRIRVTNLTNMPLADVIVTDTLLSNFQYKSATPTPNVQGNKLIWVFPTLGARESVEMVGIGVAIAGGIVENCVDVTYRMPLCVQSISVQPMLALTKTGPAEVSICDPIKYVFRIENTGTGPANNVRIIDTLPAGLVTKQGTNKIDIVVGTLLAGTARAMAVEVEAQKPGTYNNRAQAIADGGLKAASETVKTIVRKPVLAITKTGPAMQYLDREITYNISVTNRGDYPAVNTVIEDAVPSGTRFVKVSQGGKQVGNKVIWKVAKLNPGATAKMSITVMPTKMGTVVNTASAVAICAEAVTATAQTEVRGVSAILLEVIDIEDPIRIGENVTYQIQVTNQGTASGTNIRVNAILEQEMQYVSNAGATAGTFNGKDAIKFAPLSSLAPKAVATWKIIVKARGEANVRFRVTMTSDQLTRDVIETESTNFYK
ncbi:MAG: DUF11 domain-containing protein [Anaerohalosphaeraceae bacterium]|nr:DUF11 domain-containing protein [Anaerohalosphaeraceae bacterium]